MSKRKVIHLIVLLGMIISLFGCTPGTPQPAASNPTAPAQPTSNAVKAPEATAQPAAVSELEGVLSFQYWEDVEQAKSGVGETVQWQAAYDQVKEWEALHPKVKIEWSTSKAATDQDRYNAMRTSLINGTMPDLVSSYAITNVIHENTDLILDLKEYFDQPNPYGTARTWLEELPGPYEQAFQNAEDLVVGKDYKFIGHVSGLPTGADAIYYNIDAFEKAGIKDPPKTWKEFMDVSQKVMDANPGMAAYFRDTVPGMNSNWDMAYVTESVADPTYRKILAAWNTPAATWAGTSEMLWWAYDKGVLKTDGPEVMEAARIWKEWSKYWNEDYAAVEPGVNYLLTQRVAMIHDGIWASPTYLKGANENGFRVGSFAMPVIGSEVSTGGRTVGLNWAGADAFVGGTGFFIPVTTAKDPNRLKLAIDLLQYLTARPQRDRWCAAQMPPCVDPGLTVEDVVTEPETREALRGFLTFTPTNDTGYFGFWLFPTEVYKQIFNAYVNDEIKAEAIGTTLAAEFAPAWELAKKENLDRWKMDAWPEP